MMWLDEFLSSTVTPAVKKAELPRSFSSRKSGSLMFQLDSLLILSRFHPPTTTIIGWGGEIVTCITQMRKALHVLRMDG